MPYSYEILPQQKLLYFRGSGLVAYEEMRDATIAAFQDELWYTGYAILVDFEDADNVGLNFEEIRAMVDVATLVQPKVSESKIGIFAPHDNVYATSRMWEMMGASALLPVGIFRTKQETLHWLEIDSLD